MKRTIEMITMTLIIIVVAAFVGSTLMGCGGDDDSIIAISNDDGVRGGEVYNQWGKPETDPNDPLASFFQEELHAHHRGTAGGSLTGTLPAAASEPDTQLPEKSVHHRPPAYPLSR